jgi:tRNA G10  N-methylase Trm11
MPILMTNWYGCYKRGWGELMANPDAFAHPAKVSRGLARRIYEHGLEHDYFKRGDVVLDPFAGVGGFAFHAMRFGMHFIGVELEQRFVDYASGYDCPRFGEAFFRRFWHRLDRLNYKAFHLCPACVRALKADDFGGIVPEREAHRYQGNIELWNEQYAAHFSRWGSAVIVQGNSRRLGEVLAGRIEGAVSSPGYCGSEMSDERKQHNAFLRGEGRSDGRKPSRGNLVLRYNAYQTEGNVNAMPAGELDETPVAGLITSPPYAESISTRSEKTTEGNRRHRANIGRNPDSAGSLPGGEYGRSDGQLGALPLGSLDATITSPPYAASTVADSDDDPDERGGLFRDPKRRGDKTLTATYGESEGQLGAMAEGCVSSPPYEGSISAGHTDDRTRKRQAERYARGEFQYVRADIFSSQTNIGARGMFDSHYGDAEGQIGKESGDTFWTAAKQIIQQLHQVLAPGAYAIFVTKRFVRNKQIVEFSQQWATLCESCGFELIEWIRAWLVEERGTQLGLWGDDENKDVKRVSFFRRLHSQKYPHLSIDWEDVLVFKKKGLT